MMGENEQLMDLARRGATRCMTRERVQAGWPLYGPASLMIGPMRPPGKATRLILPASTLWLALRDWLTTDLGPQIVTEAVQQKFGCLLLRLFT